MEVDPYLATHPEATPRLNAALVEVQKALEPVKKEANNPFFKSKYADLANVLAAITPALNANGIALAQVADNDAAGVACITELRHVSGEILRSRFWLPVVKNDPQGYGSAFTYARRFGAKASVGLAEEDDDGESHRDPKAKTAADYTKSKPAPVKAPPIKAPAPVSERQVATDTGTSTANWSDLGEPLTPRARMEVKMGECQSSEALTLLAAAIPDMATKGELSAADTKELRSVYAKQQQAFLREKR